MPAAWRSEIVGEKLGRPSDDEGLPRSSSRAGGPSLVARILAKVQALALGGVQGFDGTVVPASAFSAIDKVHHVTHSIPDQANPRH